MPLDSEPEWVVGKFDGFNESIWGMARDAQGGRDVFESLMVVAVDFDDWLTQYVRDARTFLYFHFVHKHGPQVAGIGMVQGVEKLIGEMSV